MLEKTEIVENIEGEFLIKFVEIFEEISETYGKISIKFRINFE